MKKKEWKCPVKPEDIPNQYNWVAQDKSGEWYAYEDKPVKCKSGFAALFCYLYYLGKSNNPNWRKSLQKIPR